MNSVVKDGPIIRAQSTSTTQDQEPVDVLSLVRDRTRHYSRFQLEYTQLSSSSQGVRQLPSALGFFTDSNLAAIGEVAVNAPF
jgi:hypothetical protein